MEQEAESSPSVGPAPSLMEVDTGATKASGNTVDQQLSDMELASLLSRQFELEAQQAAEALHSDSELAKQLQELEREQQRAYDAEHGWGSPLPRLQHQPTPPPPRTSFNPDPAQFKLSTLLPNPAPNQGKPQTFEELR